MSCSPFDLKDYFLQELPSPERVQVEAHVNHCLACREELDRLQLTASALFSLRDEEIPQRIAFVSDQIFEPSPLRRWFTAFWGSTARLGFASALMLSVAIFYFAATRPAPAPGVVATRSPAVAPTMAAVTPTPQEVQQQIQLAVAKAVADVEVRQSEKNRQLVADFEHRTDEYLRSVRWMTSESEADRKRAQTTRRMAMYVQPSESGEVK
jgi:anti-sigma factor RsiW